MFTLYVKHHGQVTGDTCIVSEKYSTRKEACLKAYDYIMQITSELRSCNKEYDYKDLGDSVNITINDSENYNVIIKEMTDFEATCTILVFALLILLATAFHIFLAFCFGTLAGIFSILFFITHIPLCILLHADIIDFDTTDYAVLWGIIALILLCLREAPGIL